MQKYNDYRDNIRSGDLLAWARTPSDISKWKKFVIWAICKALRSPYYHVAIAWRVGDRLFLIEATPPVCRIDALSRRGGFLHIPVGIDISTKDDKKLLSYIGKPYSIIEAALVPLKIKPRKNSLWYCSELCRDFYKYKGLNIEGFSPEDIVNSVIIEAGVKTKDITVVAKNTKNIKKLLDIAIKTVQKI